MGALSFANLDSLFPRVVKRPGSVARRGGRRGMLNSITLEGNTVSKVEKTVTSPGLGLKKGDKILEFAGTKFTDREADLRGALMSWFQDGAQKSKIVSNEGRRRSSCPTKGTVVDGAETALSWRRPRSSLLSATGKLTATIPA